jgi:5-methylcytosine-specific restriction endonuclease McrA
MNRWKIPAALEASVLARDRRCVYCGTCLEAATGRRGDRPSWEHIVNDARIVTEANIARCCRSCNASKGARLLADWLQSDYCRQQRITPETVAEVVRRALPESSRVRP